MSTAAAKQLHLRIKSAGAPSDAQLSLIRQYTLADMTAEQLYVRTFVLAHNAIDRDNEALDDSLLNDFARTLPGKGLFVKHPLGWDGDTGPGEGRWFDARTERMSLEDARKFLREPMLSLPPDRVDVLLLYGDAYMARTDDNAALLTKIDAGVVSDVSLGFNYGDRQRLVDREGRELNAWRLMGPGEALEGSLVWLGAQPGARAVKNANRHSENDMNLQEQLDAAKAELGTLKAAKEAGEKASTSLAALKAALGANAALLDTPAELAEHVAAGKAYRDELVDAIVVGERHKGLIGDGEDAVKQAKSAYAALPASKLKVLADTIGKAAPASKVTTGDPNAGQPGAKALGADHPLNNSLIAAAPAA